MRGQLKPDRARLGLAACRGPALAAVAALAPVGCSAPHEDLVDYELYAMATAVELRLPATGGGHEDLVASIGAELERFADDYYAWADGELAALNAALTATGEFAASAAMANLLARAQQLAAATDGAFDPGVGALVELWGFADATDAPEAPPADAAIAAMRAAAGSIGDLAIDGQRIRAPPALYRLDLGGIAKGAAVDRIVARLESRSLSPALVNAGGDLRVVGEPGGRDWRIGIQAPRGGGLLGTLRLDAGEAAFTSGDYERYFERDGERFHHLLDPRTGRPVTHTQAVTVIAADGTTADAAATALFVAGPEAWRALAAQLGVTAVLRVDATGRVEMNRAMRDRFQPGAAAPSDIIVAGD